MVKHTDDETVVILRKLGIICPSFYAIYFVVGVVLALAFDLDCNNDSCRYYRLPFYYKLEEFRPEGTEKALVAWLSQVMSNLQSAQRPRMCLFFDFIFETDFGL